MAESTPRPIPVLRPGEPFSPYKRFTGSFVPEPLERSAGVSDLAKIVWARLARYAGESSDAWPAVPTLAAAIGRCPRTAYTGLRELENHGLMLTIRRPGRANLYRLLWHGIFDGSARIDEPAEVVAINQPRQMRLALAGAIDLEEITPASPCWTTPATLDPPPRQALAGLPRQALADEENHQENQEENPPVTPAAEEKPAGKAKENHPRPRPPGQRLVKRGSLILPVPKGREPEPEFDAAEQVRLFREQGLEQPAQMLEAEIAADERPKENQAPCP